MNIKFGDMEIKFPYEKYMSKLTNGENPFEAMFPKENRDYRDDFYKAFSSYFNYCGEFLKWMEKHAQTGKTGQ